MCVFLHNESRRFHDREDRVDREAIAYDRERSRGDREVRDDRVIADDREAGAITQNTTPNTEHFTSLKTNGCLH